MNKRHKMETGIKHLLIGTAVGALFFLTASFIAAIILTKSDLSYRSIEYTCFAVTAASCFLAGFISRRGGQFRGIAAGAISSLVLSVLITLVFTASCGFNYSGEVYLLLPAGVVFGMLGGIVSSNLR